MGFMLSLFASIFFKKIGFVDTKKVMKFRTEGRRCVIMCCCFKRHVFSFSLNKSDGSFFQSTSNGKLRFNYVFLEHLFPGARGTC